MHQRITCPRGATGRHDEQLRFMHVQIVPGTPNQYTTVSPSWWNGRHTCLRNRRASIPSSNLGEGTTDHSRLAQRESGCLTNSGSTVQSCHRLPVPARWPRGSRHLPAKQSNRWFESSSRVHLRLARHRARIQKIGMPASVKRRRSLLRPRSSAGRALAL